jgi:putative ABC transport system permease protein
MRYAIRTLLRTPGFTVIAVITLALGIGANTAIFSVVDGVLLRPLPFSESARIVRVVTTTADEDHGNHSAADFLDVERTNRSLAAIAGHAAALVAVSAAGHESQQMEGASVTAAFFDVLGTPAERGRTFTRAQDAGRDERLVVLSHKTYRELCMGTLNRDTQTGQSGVSVPIECPPLRLNGEPHTVVGVMPARFHWPVGARLWILSPKPVPPSPVPHADDLTSRDVRYFEAIARIRPDVTIAQAQAEMHAVAETLGREHPATSGGRDIRLRPIRDEIVGDVRPALLMLQAAVGAVLLIACANVSSLLIARASGRRRELAIRSALGASRAALLRQLLMESLVLGVTGGLAGLLLAAWLIVLLLRMVPAGLPRTDEIGLNATVAAVTLLSAVAASILFGALPAVQSSRPRATASLRDAGDRTSSARTRGRSVLVVAEIALTLVLLLAAGLFVNSFVRLQRVDSGFRPEHVVIAWLSVPRSRYPGSDQVAAVYGRLLASLSERAELHAASVGFPGPLHGGSASATFSIEGRGATDRADRPFAYVGTVSGEYFASMGIPLIAGRTFTRDDTSGAPGAAIVTAALARKHWPAGSPLGKRIKFDDDKEAWTTVVGVVADVHQLGLAQDAPPILFVPYQQFTLPFTSVAVRSALPQEAVVSLLRASLREVDPDLAFGGATTLRATLDRSVAEPRFRMALIGVFAALALALAAVGIYGLIGYSVASRTREIGIRVALGARPSQVLAPMMREGAWLGLAGCAIGLTAAFAAARVLARFLYGVRPNDPLTFASVAAVLLAVTLLASYIPARRALRVDPLAALRAE